MITITPETYPHPGQERSYVVETHTRDGYHPPRGELEVLFLRGPHGEAPRAPRRGETLCLHWDGRTPMAVAPLA